MPAYNSTAIQHPKQFHSFQTKLRHYCGQLNQQDKKSIPRSTLAYWIKSKLAGDFKSNTLWQTIDDIEPARLIFENKKLTEQNNILVDATMGLSTIIKTIPLTSSNKKNIVESIDKLKQNITLKEACDFFNITTHQYYAWKNNAGCHQSLVKLCRKKYPNQLTDAEVQLIKKYMTDEKYLQWSRITVYWQMCSTEGNRFAKSTFYKYCNLLGFGRRRGPVKCKKNTAGIKATKPGEIIHVDITEIYTQDHTKVCVLFVQDNFSRKIIGFHAALSNNGILQAATIKQALEKPGSNMDTVTIVTDGGSENKGAVDTMLAAYFPLAKKITAKADIAFANNMVEALHHKMKHQVLPKEGFKNYAEVVTKLPLYVTAYNQMPHDSLHGGTPEEIYAGILPDMDKRKADLKSATVKRLEQNKNFNCCNLLE